MKKKLVVFGAIALVLVASLLAGGFKMRSFAEGGDSIFKGVYVGSLDIGGMTEQDADVLIRDYVENLISQEVTFTVGDKSVSMTGEELGLSWSNMDLAGQAFDIGRNGNLIKRYKDRKDLENEDIVLKVTFSVDNDTLAEAMENKLCSLNTEAIDNGLKRENGNFIFIPGQEGIEIKTEESKKNIKDYFAEGLIDSLGSIELVSEITEPRGSEEELMMVKDLLGSFNTDYSTSAPGRCTNVQNATGFINGTILYPGDSFSVHDTISPITIENGYDVAGAYENGTVVESIGGGVCQVSSTLYNAVIRAELEVNERFPHSMVVTYVQPSQDAAIAGDYKDFKFTNNLEHPIYIEGYTYGKKCYFNVYGVEYRDSNRTVSFETDIESTTEPDPEFKATDAAIGSVVKIQGSHTGYKATLYKIVKINGEVQSREAFNHSTYNPSAAIYEIGTKSDNKEAVAAIKAAIKTGDLKTIQDTASYWAKHQNDVPEDEDTDDVEEDDED